MPNAWDQWGETSTGCLVGQLHCLFCDGSWWAAVVPGTPACPYMQTRQSPRCMFRVISKSRDSYSSSTTSPVLLTIVPKSDLSSNSHNIFLKQFCFNEINVMVFSLHERMGLNFGHSKITDWCLVSCGPLGFGPLPGMYPDEEPRLSTEHHVGILGCPQSLWAPPVLCIQLISRKLRDLPVWGSGDLCQHHGIIKWTKQNRATSCRWQKH